MKVKILYFGALISLAAMTTIQAESAIFDPSATHHSHADSTSFPSPTDKDRFTALCVLSWTSPLGSLNGVRQWGLDGCDYQGDKKKNGLVNYPLPLDVPISVEAAKIGSDEFYKALRAAAVISEKQMARAGFDAIAFDMLPMPDYNPKNPLDESNAPLSHFKSFLVWLDAAKETGIRVGLMPDVANQSADYPKRRNLSSEEWVKVLSGALDLTPDSPNLWKANGLPVLVHFGTDVFYGGPSPVADAPKPDGGWREVLKQLHDDGKKFYFVADVRPHKLITEWNHISDAAYIFAPASPDAFLSEYQTVVAKKLTIPLMWTISPGYYNPGLHSYTQPDFDRIHATYMAAMNAGAKGIFVMTWNDLGENTDIVPSAYKGSCLLDIFGFYNQWFKSGEQPILPNDKVIVSYPVRIPEEVTIQSPSFTRITTGGGTWNAPSYQPKVFYWAYVHAPTTLSIKGVGQVRFNRAGVWFGDLGCIAPGAVEAQLGDHIVELPPVMQTKKEGGLQYRYVNLSEISLVKKEEKKSP
jgi:hypothetical protein